MTHDETALDDIMRTDPQTPKTEAGRRPKCPRCTHLSAGHAGGTCFVQTGPNTKGKWGETVHHICGCAVWQGPRPWLMEGPAWRFDRKGNLR